MNKDTIKFTIEISPENLTKLIENLCTITKDKTVTTQGMFLDVIKKIIEDNTKPTPNTYDG